MQDRLHAGASTRRLGARNHRGVTANIFVGNGIGGAFGTRQGGTGFGTNEGGGTFRLTTNNVTAFNVVSFEGLWDGGFLTNDGLSGLTGAVFSDHFAFSQVGASANDTITAISAVPEPSSLAVLGFVGVMVASRRRR